MFNEKQCATVIKTVTLMRLFISDGNIAAFLNCQVCLFSATQRRCNNDGSTICFCQLHFTCG
jgi:hypothetical protein